MDKRAPGLCLKCPLSNNCPIREFPEETAPRQLERDPLIDHDPDVSATTGPVAPIKSADPAYVLLTIDSLGDNDAALAAHPDLPAVFVFNELALKKLQLSSRRIGFYLQTLQDLSTRRHVQTFLGDPYQFARDNAVAITYAPVPSFKKFSNLAEVFPYPWLRPPHAGSVQSFTSWRTKLGK